MLKAELHCHIEGAARPALVRRLAQKNGVRLGNIFRSDGEYASSDFTSFLKIYDDVVRVFREPEDYCLLAYDHFTQLADQGAIYGEVFVSANHVDSASFDWPDLVEAVSEGMAQAEADKGIVGRIIAVGIRHFGPEAVEEAARRAIAFPNPRVTGFGMAGDERQHKVSDFADAFMIAGDGGLELTAHAGEWCGPETIADALDHLSVTRIGHGVRAIEDNDLIDRLVGEGIVLEVCPGSNIALGVYPDFGSHPLKTLHERGVTLTLNSDDPPFFHTNLTREYDLAQREFGFSRDETEAFTRNAIEAAFVDDDTRLGLRARLNAVE